MSSPAVERSVSSPKVSSLQSRRERFSKRNSVTKQSREFNSDIIGQLHLPCVLDENEDLSKFKKQKTTSKKKRPMFNNPANNKESSVADNKKKQRPAFLEALLDMKQNDQFISNKNLIKSHAELAHRQSSTDDTEESGFSSGTVQISEEYLHSSNGSGTMVVTDDNEDSDVFSSGTVVLSKHSDQTNEEAENSDVFSSGTVVLSKRSPNEDEEQEEEYDEDEEFDEEEDMDDEIDDEYQEEQVALDESQEDDTKRQKLLNTREASLNIQMDNSHDSIIRVTEPPEELSETSPFLSPVSTEPGSSWPCGCTII